MVRLLLCLIAAYLFSTIIHECGHGIVAIFQGWKFDYLIIGPVKIYSQDKKVSVCIEKNIALWGGVCSTRPKERNEKNIKIFRRVLIAGPVASVLTGIIALIYAFSVSGLDDFLYDNCIFNCALFRKRDFLNAGKYKENMINGYENWDLWLSILEIGFKPYRINEILFNYRIQDNFRTTNSKKNTSCKIMLIKNHIESYLKDSSFAKRVFVNPDDRLRKKVKKYKNLFKLFLTLFILILVVLLFSFGL